MVGAERNFAGFGLSGGAADVGGLDAVGDRVAHEVHKRGGNLLNDAVVQFGFAAGEIELDRLPWGSGGLSDGAWPPGGGWRGGALAGGGLSMLRGRDAV